MISPKITRTVVTTMMALGFVAVATGSETEPCYTDPYLYFWKLGHMDGPHTASKALGISRDGETVVGTNDFVGTDHAMRVYVWYALNEVRPGDEEAGVPPLYNEFQCMEDLGLINPKRPSSALASSDMDSDDLPLEDYEKYEDGRNLDWARSTVVGSQVIGRTSNGVNWVAGLLGEDSIEAFDPDTGLGQYYKIPDYGGGLSQITISDVSSDGKIMVGTGNTRTGEQAFMADTAFLDAANEPIKFGMTIDDGTQTLQTSSAKALSADGGIIAGTGKLPGQGYKRAFRSVVVAELLPDADEPLVLSSTILPVADGGRWAEANAMTPDGEIIAGASDTPQGPQACIWFTATDDFGEDIWVIQILGALSHNQPLNSFATGVAWAPTNDIGYGELLVVGHSKSNQAPSEAFVWRGNRVFDPALEPDITPYFKDLEYILTKTGAGELSGMGSDWVLTEATGISVTSAYGTRIVGWGVNPEGGIEAWLVTDYPTHDDLIDDCIKEEI